MTGQCLLPTLQAVEITVVLHGSLAELARGSVHQVPAGARRSVKDLVESLGVPHTEMAAVTVDGVTADLTAQVAGGEVVAVLPPEDPAARQTGHWLLPTPPEPRRFVLDVHLGALARRLRLLGFDCWYRTAASDRLLAEVAAGQQRILLSRDRQLLMRRVVTHGYCPRTQDPDHQLSEVAGRYGLAARARPLTRCARCNGDLVRVPVEQVREQVPPRTLRAIDRYARCQGCGQVYWPGSHLAAIDRILAGAGVGLSR